jgi:hypothetical protein
LRSEMGPVKYPSNPINYVKRNWDPKAESSTSRFISGLCWLFSLRLSARVGEGVFAGWSWRQQWLRNILRLTSKLYWSPCNMAFLFYFIRLFAFTEYWASLPINFQILVATTLDSVEKVEFYGHQHLVHIGISASVFKTN